MVKTLVRFTCDRCKRYSDADNVPAAKEAGWTNSATIPVEGLAMPMIGDKNDLEKITLCPDCSSVREMVLKEFMLNKRFSLIPDEYRRPYWYISN